MHIRFSKDNFRHITKFLNTNKLYPRLFYHTTHMKGDGFVNNEKLFLYQVWK